MNLRPIVAGNWKMHKTPTEGASFVETTVNLLLDIQHVSVIFAPPFTGLFDMDVTPPFYSAAQNCLYRRNFCLNDPGMRSRVCDSWSLRTSPCFW